MSWKAEIFHFSSHLTLIIWQVFFHIQNHQSFHSRTGFTFQSYAAWQSPMWHPLNNQESPGHLDLSPGTRDPRESLFEGGLDFVKILPNWGLHKFAMWFLLSSVHERHFALCLGLFSEGWRFSIAHNFRFAFATTFTRTWTRERIKRLFLLCVGHKPLWNGTESSREPFIWGCWHQTDFTKSNAKNYFKQFYDPVYCFTDQC